MPKGVVGLGLLSCRMLISYVVVQRCANGQCGLALCLEATDASARPSRSIRQLRVASTSRDNDKCPCLQESRLLTVSVVPCPSRGPSAHSLIQLASNWHLRDRGTGRRMRRRRTASEFIIASIHSTNEYRVILRIPRCGYSVLVDHTDTL